MIPRGLQHILAKQSEYPQQYNIIQRLFGSQTMWKRFAQQYVDREASENILDLGCGTAEIVPYLSPHISYLGIDNNPRYIRSCQARYPQQEFVIGDWRQLSLSSQDSPDLILCLGLLHHLPDREARTMLESCYHHLRSGGRILSLDGVWEDDCGQIERFFYRIDRGNYIRNSREYSRLFPHPPALSIHENWLRIPYRYAVCELRKP